MSGRTVLQGAEKPFAFMVVVKQSRRNSQDSQCCVGAAALAPTYSVLKQSYQILGSGSPQRAIYRLF